MNRLIPAAVATTIVYGYWGIATGPLSETPVDADEYAALVSYVRQHTGVKTAPPPVAAVVSHPAWRVRNWKLCWRIWKHCDLVAFYRHDNKIEIDARLLNHPVVYHSVIVHELRHWADHMRGGSLTDCAGSERRARALQNRWLADHGQTWMVPLDAGC